MVSGALRRDDPGRAAQDAGGGLPPDRGPDRSGDQLGAPAEVAHARQAVLHVLRAGGDARAAPRAEGVDRQVQGSLRRRVGRDPGRDVRPSEGTGTDPRRRRSLGAARRDPGVGRRRGGSQADPGAPDGGLRRVPRAHRPPPRAPLRRAHRDGHPRRHLDLLHRRRQRRQRGGNPERDLQRADLAQRCRRVRDHRVHGWAHRRVRRTRGLQPLCGRVGARDEHALPVDQAGRLALRWYPQRHDRALAERHQGQG